MLSRECLLWATFHSTSGSGKSLILKFFFFFLNQGVKWCLGINGKSKHQRLYLFSQHAVTLNLDSKQEFTEFLFMYDEFMFSLDCKYGRIHLKMCNHWQRHQQSTLLSLTWKTTWIEMHRNTSLNVDLQVNGFELSSALKMSSKKNITASESTRLHLEMGVKVSCCQNDHCGIVEASFDWKTSEHLWSEGRVRMEEREGVVSYMKSYLSLAWEKKSEYEMYEFTKPLYVSVTGDWEADSAAPVALRCDVITLSQRLPSRLIIWLAALTKTVDQRAQSAANPPQAAVFPSPRLGDFTPERLQLIFTLSLLLLAGQYCVMNLYCLLVTAVIKPHHKHQKGRWYWNDLYY